MQKLLAVDFDTSDAWKTYKKILWHLPFLFQTRDKQCKVGKKKYCLTSFALNFLLPLTIFYYALFLSGDAPMDALQSAHAAQQHRFLSEVF